MLVIEGVKLSYKSDPSITAKVIFVDGDEVTILVDGYAASDTYSLGQLADQWSVKSP